MAEKKRKGYILELEKGAYPDSWQWQILDPQGNVNAYGASRGKEKEVIDRISKDVKRLNSMFGGKGQAKTSVHKNGHTVPTIDHAWKRNYKQATE